MSNDLIKSIQASLAVSQGVDEDTRAVAGQSSGNKRISIKGGVFRKFVGGKQVSVVEGRDMNVIFVKMAHNASRTYYPKGFVEGEKVSPICWSSDGNKPDEGVKSPQASSCASCPMSIKGSGQNGTGTACRLQWRTAVVLPHDPNGDVMQLVLPATSAFGKEVSGKYPFRPYIQMLANNNISAGYVVTKMQFDVDSTAPKLLFSAAAAVPDDVIEIVRQQGASQAAQNAVKMTVFQQDEGEVAAPVVQEEAEEVAEPSPVKRPSKPAAAEGDIPDVIKKWSKKS
jgi:hypothetical protein